MLMGKGYSANKEEGIQKVESLPEIAYGRQKGVDD